MGLEVELRIPMLKRLLQANPEAIFEQAAVRALNRSADSGKVLAVRAIANDLGLSQSEELTRGKSLDDLVGVKYASAGSLVAKVSPSRTRIPLIRFKATGPYPSRGRGQGVRASVGPGRRTVYPHSFIATMPSGHTGVFKRTEPGRLPVAELFGPSPAKSFRKFKYIVWTRGIEQLRKNLRSEIRFALFKRAA